MHYTDVASETRKEIDSQIIIGSEEALLNEDDRRSVIQRPVPQRDKQQRPRDGV